ncbi:DEAD/DEAH box helicase family protein [Agaribacter marinus]|uniref:DEAD/DEAH box helicase n=1 Tax=Virgibacillus salarius TaxID=447199 RepID=A0A941IE62_9BACI|nr:SNF2-related protein [Virgibacillus salarius]MBR7797790.1 DEAD/DEAH box helicase [Virgibacillus salarius]NAZ10500.1 DEAD/DEAH box helicase family protein [Agaribacter marinus]
MKSIHIEKDSTFINELENRLEMNEPISSWELFSMAFHAEKTTMTPSFKGLRALEFLPHVDFLNHQISSAEQVIEQMNGRAILADEVGLGKTIEAGLILKEYMIRGLVNKALILAPASLVNQWEKELNEKFYIPAVAYRKNMSWEQGNIIISSMDTAKRSPHRDTILNLDYDFVLVDEAHKLKNHKTKNFAFVRSLKKKYCLLLTATPVQNQLVEIFNLVSILKPGHLGNYDTFLKSYGKDRKNMKQDMYLKQLVQKVMVRNTRKDTGLNQIKRNIETIWTEFSKEEKEVYESLEDSSVYLPSFSKITFLREFCSSREACYLSLKKMLAEQPDLEGFQRITEAIEQLPNHKKAEKAVELIKEIGNEKIIIFTEYRATQLYLQWYLQQNGISSVPFRGGFKRGKKDWMRQLFRDHAQVLIATEAGGEGINLQFCNYMINYDLPWNPMRLEQRIGRIHRYGQNKDVHIYNFALKDTVEEHIMKLLYEKINLFEQVIGHLDDILAELAIPDIEHELQEIYSESTTTGEAKVKLNNLSAIIQQTHDTNYEEEQYYGNT